MPTTETTEPTGPDNPAPTGPNVAPSGPTPTPTDDYKPAKPIMGDLVQVSTTDYCPWTGGRPKHDWSGLSDEAPKTPKSTFQMRPVSPGSSQKSTTYREIGLDPKFKLTDNLRSFIDNVDLHLTRRGMDSIAYLPDPNDPMSMISTVTDNQKFCLGDALKAQDTLHKKFDTYDMNNDESARLWLLDSLEPTLKETLQLRMLPTHSFVAHWLCLLKLIQSTSYSRFARLKSKIEKDLSIKQFPGQNVSLLASAFIDVARELENNGQYEHRLTLTMVDRFLEAGAGSEGPDLMKYQHKLLIMHSDIDNALRHISRMDGTEQDTYMGKKGLTYRDACQTAEDSWRTLSDDNKWAPAKLRQDSRRPPASLRANVATLKTTKDPEQLQVLVNALIQNLQENNKDQPSSKPKGNCFHCGASDHWARDCPKKKQNQKGARSAKSDETKHHSWKCRPPRDTPNAVKLETVAGAEHFTVTRPVTNKTFHWCQKCKRWSTNHWTHTHTGKSPTGKGPSPSANTFTYLGDSDDSSPTFAPCAFFVCPEIPPVDPAPLWPLLLPYVCLALLGLSWVARSPFAPLLWFSLGWGIRLLDLPPQPIYKALPRLNPSRIIKQVLNHLHRVDRTRPSHRPRPPRSRRCNSKLRGRKRNPNNHCPAWTGPPWTHNRPWKETDPDPDPWRSSIPDELHSLRSRGVHAPAPRRHQPRRTRCNQHSSRHERNSACQYTPWRFTNKKRRTRIKARPPVVTCYPDPADSIFNVFLCMFQSLQACLTDRVALSCNTKNPKQLIWDSGASVSLTPDPKDFVGPIKPPPAWMKLKGISNGLQVTGVGVTEFTVIDSKGQPRSLRSSGVLCPKSQVRLLSTSALLQTYPNESISLKPHGLTLSGTTGPNRTNSVSVPLDPKSNLPTCQTFSQSEIPFLGQPLAHNVSVVDRANRNLTEADKELLRWHHRLGHMSFRRIQALMRQGVLAKSANQRALHSRASRQEFLPKCAACLYAKAKRLPTRRHHKTHQRVSDAPPGINQNTLQPGQQVSVDHYICSTLGRLYSGFGKTSDAHMYKGGCLFVDNSSNYVKCYHQVSMDTHETIRSKETFEFQCRDVGIQVQSYLTDQASSFTSQEFEAHLQQFHQVSRVAGTGGHHHNGMAEKAIQDVMAIARTLLIHAAIHWPDMCDPQLWPMALDHAAYIFNHVPKTSSGLSSADLFTRTRWPHRKFHDIHVWGCPCYVLEKRIADGKSIPRFQARSARHIFMGLSPRHGYNVPFCLNPATGAITTPFHVVYDDEFATVTANPANLPNFGSPEWTNLFGDEPTNADLPEPDTPTSGFRDLPPLPAYPEPSTPTGFDNYSSDTTPYSPPAPDRTPNAPPPEVPTNQPEPPATAPPPQREPVPEREPPAPPKPAPQREALPADPPPPAPVPIPTPAAAPAPPVVEREKTSSAPPPAISSRLQRELRRIGNHNNPSTTAATPSGPRRSRRLRPRAHLATTYSPLSHITTPSWNVSIGSFEHHTEHFDFRKGFLTTPALTRDHSSYRTLPDSPDCGYYEVPRALLGLTEHGPSIWPVQMDTLRFEKKSVSDPNILSWSEAMAESPENRVKWLEAADIEIKALEKQGTWEETSLSKATVKVIPGQWVFRRKICPHDPTKVLKWKARWVLRGDLQDITFDTYASVVAWPTVRMFLCIGITLGWTIKALDFSSAFVQADIDHDVYTYLPRGYISQLRTSDGDKACLRLRKSLYGIAAAPRLWRNHCMKQLRAIGFRPSKFDPNLLFGDDMLLVLYVDDCGLAVKDPAKVDWFVKELRDRGLELDVEGDFTAFLGVAIERSPDGHVSMSQPSLIDKVLEATNMQSCNPNWTPSTLNVIGSDPDGEPYDNSEWNMASVIGMLIYLCTNTRPDISCTVSMIARHVRNPKQSHATAVKTLLRYLKRTKLRGIQVTISKSFQLTCYVDAEFCGLFGIEPASNKDSAKSRAGWIILLNNLPIAWKSVLLGSVCLSTFESEYQALSMAMQQVLGYRNLLLETATELSMPQLKSSIQARVLEDNNSALSLANNQRITNRTRYLVSKWHHFWQHVLKDEEEDPSGTKIRIIKVDTRYQGADYLTKPLTRELFENNRKLIQGW